MAKMRRASRVAALGLLLVSFLAFVYYVLIEEMLRQWFVRGLQRSAGLGALRNAPVSLGALAVRGWSLELRHLRLERPGLLVRERRLRARSWHA